MLNVYFLQGGINFHLFNDEYETRDLTAAPVKMYDTQVGQIYMDLNKFEGDLYHIV